MCCNCVMIPSLLTTISVHFWKGGCFQSGILSCGHDSTVRGLSCRGKNAFADADTHNLCLRKMFFSKVFPCSNILHRIKSMFTSAHKLWYFIRFDSNSKTGGSAGLVSNNTPSPQHLCPYPHISCCPSFSKTHLSC